MNTQGLINVLEDANFNVSLVEGGTEIVIACPLCFSETQKLYIEAATGLWLCMKCDRRGHLRGLLVEVCELSVNEAYTLERSLMGGKQRPLMHVSRPAPASTVDLPPGFLRDPGDGLAVDYFKRRGLLPGWVWELEIGYCLTGPYARRVIIPIITQGAMRTFVARTWMPEEKKVLMPPGSQAERALFGYDQLVADREQWTNLILVEGVFDAIRMWENGHRETVATLGAHVTDLQRSLVKRLAPECVILLRDADDAGREAAIKEARGLATNMIPVSIAPLSHGDPGAASLEDIRQALDNALPVELDFGTESLKEVHQ
jgi:hypothetical protein